MQAMYRILRTPSAVQVLVRVQGCESCSRTQFLRFGGAVARTAEVHAFSTGRRRLIVVGFCGSLVPGTLDINPQIRCAEAAYLEYWKTFLDARKCVLLN